MRNANKKPSRGRVHLEYWSVDLCCLMHEGEGVNLDCIVIAVLWLYVWYTDINIDDMYSNIKIEGSLNGG